MNATGISAWAIAGILSGAGLLAGCGGQAATQQDTEAEAGFQPPARTAETELPVHAAAGGVSRVLGEEARQAEALELDLDAERRDGRQTRSRDPHRSAAARAVAAPRVPEDVVVVREVEPLGV